MADDVERKLRLMDGLEEAIAEFGTDLVRLLCDAADEGLCVDAQRAGPETMALPH
jgi:hypothetical protein